MARDRYGDPDVLSLKDIETPEPKRDEVLLRVRAAGVDMGTWHVVAGLPYAVRLAFGVRRPAPVPGMDVAGTVVAVGDRVTRFRPGDEVFGVGRATFAEYATARTVVPKPANLTFEQAGAVAVSACTALTAVRDVRAGHRVLVTGAGGGVGSYVVQLAALAGAEVTGVCGPTKVALVRDLGAAAVLDYTRDELTGEYDVIVDIAGGRPFPVLRRRLTPTGALVLVGTEEGGRYLGMGRAFGGLVRAPFTRQHIRAPLSVVRTPALERLGALLAAGEITPAIDRAFALRDLPAALTYLREGRARGKVVVTP